MAKHLNHYCGPATVVNRLKGRSRNYELSLKDEAGNITSYFKDISMIVPAHEMPRAEDITDPSDIPMPDPILHDDKNTPPLKEGTES